MGEDADQLLLHYVVFSGIFGGALSGDEGGNDLLSFVAGARNLEEAQLQLVALRSSGALALHFCDAAFQGGAAGNAALPLLPCGSGLDEERSAFRGSHAVHTAEKLRGDRSLLGHGGG